MSAVDIGPVIDRLRRRAHEDAALAETLSFLAQDDDVNPFWRPDEAVLAGVRTVNAQRLAARRNARSQRGLTTAQVVELIDSLSDRRAVDRRRHRGRLLGLKAGGTVLHPDWQFDVAHGETRAGLDRVLAAAAQVTDDPVVVDALMTAPRADLGGGTITSVFAAGDVDTVVQLIRLSGDQS